MITGTSSNGNIFHITGPLWGEPSVTAGIVLWMHPANDRWCYNVTPSLIGWAHSQNDNCTGRFPSQRPVMWSFDVFFDLRLNKRLSKQSRHRWFETPLSSFWRHSDTSLPVCVPCSPFDIDLNHCTSTLSDALDWYLVQLLALLWYKFYWLRLDYIIS